MANNTQKARIYHGVRIYHNGNFTYGDQYRKIHSDQELQYNDIVDLGNDKYLILFEDDLC